MNAFKITKTTHPKPKPDESRLGFGKYYTDHMLLIDYTAGIGWHDAPALLARQTALSITIALLMMTPINVRCMQHCIVAKS